MLRETVGLGLIGIGIAMLWHAARRLRRDGWPPDSRSWARLWRCQSLRRRGVPPGGDISLSPCTELSQDARRFVRTSVEKPRVGAASVLSVSGRAAAADVQSAAPARRRILPC